MAAGKGKAPDTKMVRALLDRHACPVPFHAVRTRFLGNIATPMFGASPLRVVEGLWGGELPEFDSMAEAETLIGLLVQGLWNDLARHQKRSQPFRWRGCRWRRPPRTCGISGRSAWKSSMASSTACSPGRTRSTCPNVRMSEVIATDAL